MPRPFKKKVRGAIKTMNEKDSVVPDDHETDEGVTASAKGEKKKETSKMSDSENNDKKVKSPIKAVVIKSPIKAIDIKSGSSDSSSDSSSSSDSDTEESNKIRYDEAGSVGGGDGEDVNASEQSASEITCNSENYEGFIDNLFEASQQQKTQQQRQQQHHQNHQDPGGGGDGDRGGGGSGGDGSHSGEGACAANSDDRASSTNLIINYLPQNMADKELYDLFSSCGSINTCKIMRDFKTGYSFGYGFVDFNEEADSEDAIQKFNGFLVRNKRLKVSYARPGGQSIKDTNLYVINLSRNINDDQLDRIFSPFGLIVQRNILRDRQTGRPRGVAFVRYNKREEAQEAIAALNNTIPENGSQPIFVRLAEEHGKAKAAQFMSQVGGGGVPPHMSPAAAQQQMAPQQHHMMGGHMQQPLRPAQYPRHQQQAPYQQQQQHQPQHIRDMQQHFIHQYNLQPPLPHHMQQLQPHPHGGGGGRIGVGVGGGGGVGLPQSIHGGSGGYHHNMANRAASHR